MATIFVSHSSRDKDLVDFFLRASNLAGIKLIFESLETVINGPATVERIHQHIAESNAAFILLSPNVNKIPHTRDWVLYEAGTSSNKDVWVFERHSDRGQISVAIPRLQHYVVYDLNESSMVYVTNIARGYDDAYILATALGAGIGAALAEEKNKLQGAVTGAMATWFFTKKGTRPLMGETVRCFACQAVYSAHLPQRLKSFRCPVCNKWLVLTRRAEPH